MSNIKTQATKLIKAFYTVTRGSNVTLCITHAHNDYGNAYDVYATWLGNDVVDKGAPLVRIYDLELGNIPDIMNAVHKATGHSIYVGMMCHVKPRKRTIYTLNTKYDGRYLRIGYDLANVLHESAVRDDEITIDNSKRLADVAFNDYIDHYTYITLGD